MKTYKVLNTDFSISEIKMGDDATVADLKNKFTEMKGNIQPDDFIFKFRQRELRDDFRLGRLMESENHNIEVHPVKKKNDVFSKFGL